MAVIHTMGVFKQYKEQWGVDHLDLRVEQGDIFGLIDPDSKIFHHSNINVYYR